jgi:deazaflavin-dependent oxidoreductase (nitroreductase family)
MEQPRPRPPRWAKPVFDAPTWLYRHRLGWVLGRRFLTVTHIGHRSGKVYQTVLSVVRHDPDSGESVVTSAYGTRADWYVNLQRMPARLVQIAGQEFIPEQRFLDDAEAREVAIAFCKAHPLRARGANSAMAAIGAIPKDTFCDPVDLYASLPMIAFRPRTTP